MVTFHAVLGLENNNMWGMACPFQDQMIEDNKVFILVFLLFYLTGDSLFGKPTVIHHGHPC